MIAGYQFGFGVPIASEFADSIVTSTSAADVRPNAQTFVSDTLSVIFQWDVGEVDVTWTNSLIKIGQIIHITNVDNVRLREGYDTVIADGSAIIRRSSGSVNESAAATLSGVA